MQVPTVAQTKWWQQDHPISHTCIPQTGAISISTHLRKHAGAHSGPERERSQGQTHDTICKFAGHSVSEALDGGSARLCVSVCVFVCVCSILCLSVCVCVLSILYLSVCVF